MPINPYSAPQAALRDPAEGPGSTVKAVLAGSAIYFFGTTLMVIGILLLYVMVSVDGELTMESFGAAMGAFEDTSWIDITAIASERAMLVLAGFVATRMARRRDFRVAAILALLAMVLFALSEWLMPENYTLGQKALLLLSVGAAAPFGGWLAHRR